MAQVINKDAASQEISKLIYAYDKASRRSKIDLAGGSINYSYDNLNQLLGEAAAGESQNYSFAYTYDPIGNRMALDKNGKAANYAYNNLNQLTQSGATQKIIQVKGAASDANTVTVKVNGVEATLVSGQFTADNIPLSIGPNTIAAEATDVAGNKNSHQINVTYDSPGAAAYTYDKNGNLIQRKTNLAEENFTYDFDNRLKTFSGPTQNAGYTYNGIGKRVAKVVNGVVTTYYWDGDEIILEKSGQNTVYYIHGPRIDELIADSRGYCYHADGLGSIVSLTDASGAKVQAYAYDAFGNVLQQEGEVPNCWLYTGRQFDSESGLYYYRNRYYDSRVGRFITRDPLGFAAGPNLYAYVGNNPVNLLDPWGLCGEKTEGKTPVQRIVGELTPSDVIFLAKQYLKELGLLSPQLRAILDATSSFLGNKGPLETTGSIFGGILGGAAGAALGGITNDPLTIFVLGGAGSYIGSKWLGEKGKYADEYLKGRRGRIGIQY